MSDDGARARKYVADGLRDASDGARGLVHRVTLSFSRIGYVYEALVARGRLDPMSGAVVWEEFPAQNSWGRLNGLFAETVDGMPPEAVAAGLADAEADQDRRRCGLPTGSPSGRGGEPWG
ncbi:hypothetical protein [Actinomadura alba]|uniref:hypothetical protein n=1 Tax=Actinomadura alba TaxID=406431 RepID=UPI001C9C7A78|nr:hypothetical protein [Actinomadura alba]